MGYPLGLPAAVAILALASQALAQTLSVAETPTTPTASSIPFTSTIASTSAGTALATYSASIPTYLASIASSYSLTGSASLPLPVQTASTSETQDFIKSNWDLVKDKITFGASGLTFVDDPGEATAAGSVLKVDYPAGSYSHLSGATGGTQFYAEPIAVNSTDSSQGGASALLTYSVYFPANFSWVQGGKLPGLRGGSSTNGCSGGTQADGTSCFSTRLMWRKNGAGEVYAYVPRTTSLCSSSNIVCQPDFGTSFGPGEFSFKAGAWNQVAIYVALNNPPSSNNGIIQMWYNGVQAISFSNVEIRSADTLSGIGGVFFSTFFGGDDSSWATPSDQSTYFKDIVLFSSSQASTAKSAANERLVLSTFTTRLVVAAAVGLLGWIAV